MANDTPQTSGYDFPTPFQPQGKAAWLKSLTNKKKLVIKKPQGKKPIVKKKR